MMSTLELARNALKETTECLAAQLSGAGGFAVEEVLDDANAAIAELDEAIKQKPDSLPFIERTNKEHSEWMATFYSDDADTRTYRLHSLWAWQEQERRKEAIKTHGEPVAEVVSYHQAGLYDKLPIGTLLYTYAPTAPTIPEGWLDDWMGRYGFALPKAAYKEAKAVLSAATEYTGEQP